MAPTKIKREADLTPPPRRGLGSFQNDPETMGTLSATGGFVKPPDPDWKQCDGDNRHSRVITKEQAAKKAVSALRKMSNTLTMHLLATPTCQIRINKIRKSHFGFTTASIVMKSSAMILITYLDEILARKKVRAGGKYFLIIFS
jgi:hypothetical protein